MTAIEVTPAGTQLYRVVITDTEYDSRHEVSVPDDLLGRLDTRDVAMQDVVRAAVELLLDREGQDALDASVDLGAVVARDPDLLEEIPRQARRRATDRTPPPGQHVDDREAPSGDERLRREVEQEQDRGRVSEQERRL